MKSSKASFTSEASAIHFPVSFGPIIYLGTIFGLKYGWGGSALTLFFAWFFRYLTGGKLAESPPTVSALESVGIDYVSILCENLQVWFVLYLTVHAFAYWLPTRKLIHHLKFNPEYPDHKLVLKEFARSVRGIAIGSVLEYGLYFSYGRERVLSELSGGPPIEAKSIVMFGLLLYAWGDFHFYWTHRLLHASPWLYKHVHKEHHESFNPDPFSGLSMHPIESTIYFSSGIMLSPLVSVGVLPMWSARLLCKALILSPLDGCVYFYTFFILP